MKLTKRWIALLLILVLGLGIGLGVLIGSKPQQENEPAALRHEGNGYASPTEAMQAFFDYFKAGDLRGMTSVFAIETFIEHLDAEKYITIMRYINHNAGKSYPLTIAGRQSSFAKALAVESYYNDVSNRVIGMYYLTFLPEEVRGSGSHIAFNRKTTEQEIQAALAALEGAFSKNYNESARLIRVLSADDLAGLQSSDRNHAGAAYKEQMRSYMGFDELEEAAVHFEMNGNEYYAGFTFGRYGDKWYIVGPLPTLLYLETFTPAE